MFESLTSPRCDSHSHSYSRSVRAARRRPLLSLALLLAPAAAGCGGDPPPEPTVVTIKPSNPPALVAFRADAGADAGAAEAAWQTVTAASDGTFQVRPTGPYHVIIVCEAMDLGFGSIQVKQYARTPEDGTTLEHACGRTSYPFHVRGQMAQGGMAYFGALSRGSFDPQWALDVPTAPGSFDLVLRSGTQLAIRRDIAVTGDTDLGAIDLSQESPVALVPVPYTISNQLQDELISTASYLDTGRTTATLQDGMSGSGAWTPRLAPESMLRSTDRQTAVFMTARLNIGPKQQNYYRFLERAARIGDATTGALPEPLGAVAFERSSEGGIDRVVATGATFPEHDELSLAWSSASMSAGKVHTIALSRTFLDASAEPTIALELRDIPGFKDEWRHAAGSQQVYELTATRRLSGEILRSQMNEWVQPVQAVR